jgi:light-regulated signal transduction histidine kinase (bacteriophytochrome)
MVASYGELLAERYRGKLDADADEFIGYLLDGARRMQQLIRDLLAYSRVSTRGHELQPAAADACLDLALANLASRIEETGSAIEREPLPAVLADQLQLVQLFQNLIGNALKFRGADPPRVRVSARRDNHDWIFSVADNGIGIPPEDRERVFLIFERGHTEREYPGTGIGLAICRRIVERHGGRIWVESETGRGSTFQFSLRAAEAHATASTAAPA